MDSNTLNLILNAVTLLLGGGALAAVLRYRSKMVELHNADEANIRDHYAREVAALREANFRLEKHFREMIDDMEKRHNEDREDWEKRWRQSEADHETCKRERTLLREEIDGLKRQITAQAAERVIALGDVATEQAPHAAASAPRVKKIVENGK